MFQTPQKQAAKPVLYIAYSDQTVQAYLLELQDGAAKFLEQSDQHSFSDEKTALIRTDECLQQLGSQSESVSEVLLGLDPNWVHNGEIAPEKKEFLKKVFTDLSLKPLGFISFAEALSQQYIARDSAASLLLIYCAEEKLSIVAIRKGTIERAESVGRSGDVVADLTEGLARFGQDQEVGENYLPSTIVLASFALSDDAVSDIQQQLLGHSWTGSGLFLHAPVVTVVSHQEVVQAIALEAGAALLGSTMSLAPPDESSFPKTFGIPIASTVPKQQPEFGELISEDAEDPAQRHQHDALPSPFSAHHIKRSVVIGLALGFLALIGLTVVAVQVLMRATITIVAAQKPISEELEITLDPQATGTDTEKRVLAAVLVTQDVTGEDSMQTTGVTIVGEKASGEVVLYNKTTSEKTFEVGTSFSIGAVGYHLVEAATIPAAKVEQSGSREVKDYGQKNVRIEADKIGDTGNQAEKAELTVASFATSSYSAEVTKTGLTGGSSREVRVVSEEDMVQLKKEVTRKILDAANEDFKRKSGDGTYILPSTTLNITKTEFDAEPETEAGTLSLTITATVSALSYSVEDIKPIAESVLQAKVPEGYTLSTEDPQVLSAPTEQSGDVTASVTLSANISSYAVPIIDTQALAHAVKNKSLPDAQSYLQDVPTVSGVQISMQPSVLAPVYKKLPSSSEKITIIVSQINE